jgi:hypothetical protein
MLELLMRRSWYSCLPWGFRSCAKWCNVARLQFPAVSKELLLNLASKYAFLSWILLFLHFVAGCIKEFLSVRSAKSDNVVCRGCACIRQQWAAFAKPFLPWKSYKYYIFWVCMCVSACRLNLARKTDVSYYIVIYGLSSCTIFFHIISKTAFIFKRLQTIKIGVLILSKPFVWNV